MAASFWPGVHIFSPPLSIRNPLRLSPNIVHKFNGFIRHCEVINHAEIRAGQVSFLLDPGAYLPSLRKELIKGPITWRTFNPGVELSPVNRVEIFCDYMDDFNPGVETLYYTFSASIPGSKKAFVLFSCNK